MTIKIDQKDELVANAVKTSKVSDFDAEMTWYFQSGNCEKDVNLFHYWTL